jgi:Ca2+-binding RTX toxin-like protein
MMAADTTKPVLTSLSLPSSIDVSKGSVAVTATIGASDIGLGVDQVYVHLDHAIQTPNGPSSYFYLYDSSDSFADGISSTTNFFTQNTAPGTYTISDISIYDKAGNYTVYYTSDLSRLGFQTSIFVSDATRIDGSVSDDVLFGTDRDDVLNGGIGADIMFGGKGNDSYFVDVPRDQVVEKTDEGFDVVYSDATTYQISDDVEALVLYGNAVRGIGNAGDNVLIGNALDNVLDGGPSGSDQLSGGAGNDSYFVHNSSSVAFENANEGFDVVYSDAGLFQISDNIEGLVLYGSGIRGIGNASDNVLIGNALDNVLDGGPGGNDQLSGGAGNDSYFVHNPGSIAFENAGEGFDVVYSDAAVYQISDNVEALVLYGNGIRAIGNAGDNFIAGNALDNVLDGGVGGNDQLVGGAGNDSYFVHTSGSTVTENAGGGYDIVYSDAFAFQLSENIEALSLYGNAVRGTGNAGNNLITGNTLDNVLDGGVSGYDFLTGGAGRDSFVYQPTGFARITIQDFNVAAGETIQIDHTRLGSFAEVQSHAFQNGTDTLIQIDQDHAIKLVDVTAASLTSANFLFV